MYAGQGPSSRAPVLSDCGWPATAVYGGQWGNGGETGAGDLVWRAASTRARAAASWVESGEYADASLGEIEGSFVLVADGGVEEAAVAQLISAQEWPRMAMRAWRETPALTSAVQDGQLESGAKSDRHNTWRIPVNVATR
jgi:hypothetical protein